MSEPFEVFRSIALEVKELNDLEKKLKAENPDYEIVWDLPDLRIPPLFRNKPTLKAIKK